MTLFERVSTLSKKQGKSLKVIAEELGLSRHAFYSWKTSSPKAESLEKVANYFDVSVDYLLGRTNNPNTLNNAKVDSEDEYEQELLMMFRKGEKEVTPEKRDLYRKQVKDLMSFVSKTLKELDEDHDK
ncbi:helix-turn-helix domain-containing protein [Enterococcus sp. AZ072]|uniref:helix-turn-helix domain-containing protein n=1 Tax=unclassified Enterococcus TaxID=2608891 RepID=UPI003D2B4D84